MYLAHIKIKLQFDLKKLKSEIDKLNKSLNNNIVNVIKKNAEMINK
jgi:hypothetical protein